MLSVTVLAVGALGESHWRDAAAEYTKRLGAYCKLQVLELPESRLPQNPSSAQIRKGLETEGAQILAKLPRQAKLLALCVEGKPHSSEQFATCLEQLAGLTSHVALAVGGSHGLSDAVKAAAHIRLSMGPMTYPHQLARILLLEQLYRAFSINAGGRYHK